MPPSSLPTPPVLLLAWRRPHTTRQVIEALRPAAPQQLYVACDGPNPARPGEAEKVAETRAVIEAAVDWPCRLERRYSEGNQGCRLGVSRTLSWFFEQEERRGPSCSATTLTTGRIELLNRCQQAAHFY